MSVAFALVLQVLSDSSSLSLIHSNGGLCHMIQAKMYNFMKRSLPQQSRPTSLSSTDWAWALHSESQDSLVRAPDSLVRNSSHIAKPHQICPGRNLSWCEA